MLLLEEIEDEKLKGTINLLASNATGPMYLSNKVLTYLWNTLKTPFLFHPDR